MKCYYNITIVLMEEPWTGNVSMKENVIIFSELEYCDRSYEIHLKSWSAEILII